MGSKARSIESADLLIAVRRFKRARVRLARAMRAECPGQVLVDRGQSFQLDGDTIRQSKVVTLAAPRPAEPKPAEGVPPA